MLRSPKKPLLHKHIVEFATAKERLGHDEQFATVFMPLLRLNVFAGHPWQAGTLKRVGLP
jgi:hypothetical protein